MMKSLISLSSLALMGLLWAALFTACTQEVPLMPVSSYAPQWMRVEAITIRSVNQTKPNRQPWDILSEDVAPDLVLQLWQEMP